MSAFALRKRLLSQQAVGQPDESGDSSVAPATAEAADCSQSRNPKRARKAQSQLDIALKGPTFQAPSVSEQGQSNLNDSLTRKDFDSILLPSQPLPSAPSHTASPTPVNDILPPLVSASKWSGSNHATNGDGIKVLELSGGERLVILGNYGIRVTHGEVTISGATLTVSDKMAWVNAPQCHALPVIRCPEDAKIELHCHPDVAGLMSLANLSPQFRRLWNENTSSPLDGSPSSSLTYQILGSSDEGPKRAVLHSPPEWNREVANLVHTAKSRARAIAVVVTGPKSSGKSTFGKILANRLVTERWSNGKKRYHGTIAVLDLDPGQPEYCVAGHVALVRIARPVLGPSFCHPQGSTEVQVVRSHALASISPASDPELYMEAVADLVAHYRNTMKASSLIVNTPGWIQGTGLDLLTSIIDVMQPTDVIYMSESGPAEAVEALGEACSGTRFATLPSQDSQLTSRTAAEFRSMQIMSYFHAETTKSSVQWNADPLTRMSPWQVGYLGPECGIFGVMCYDYQPSLEMVADAINGTVVAVVAIESIQAFRSLAEPGMTDDAMDVGSLKPEQLTTFPSTLPKLISTTPEGIPVIATADGSTLDPRYSRSLGLALIRGIDNRRKVLQLLTPVPMKDLNASQEAGEVIVLVSGKFDTPSWAYTEDLYSHNNNRNGGEGEDTSDAEESADTTDDDVVVGGSEDQNSTDANPNPVPWIEILRGNQKRGAGSQVWRVRRDLGRAANNAD
ncbi:hypothetical protein GGR52DRAFT_575237 [Hypoxylon sp. FL1284]|nr:hypothetical protein GGR52DRAFT_575237 [Hypoxylon sp. FL1284]